MSSSFVHCSDSVEVVLDDEHETIDQIIASPHRLSDRTQQKEGHAIRVSHAKSHGFAVGELGSFLKQSKKRLPKRPLRRNKVLHAVGGDSAHLDLIGAPRVHPLGEAYYAQAPIRYGDYVAKLAAVPVAPAQVALENEGLDTAKGPNALRTATVGYLREHDAVFDIRVQLCTDLETMPVENANTEWSENESPYQTVARLTLPRQEACSDARRAYGDDALSFSPAHSLAAHRPLGAIMRARLRAYPEMSRYRRSQSGEPLSEPKSVDKMPA